MSDKLGCPAAASQEESFVEGSTFATVTAVVVILILFIVIILVVRTRNNRIRKRQQQYSAESIAAMSPATLDRDRAGMAETSFPASGPVDGTLSTGDDSAAATFATAQRVTNISGKGQKSEDSLVTDWQKRLESDIEFRSPNPPRYTGASFPFPLYLGDEKEVDFTASPHGVKDRSTAGISTSYLDVAAAPSPFNGRIPSSSSYLAVPPNMSPSYITLTGLSNDGTSPDDQH